MQLSTLPHLAHALAVLATDIGAMLNLEAELPPKWLEGAQAADIELSWFTLESVEQLVLGEELDQEQLRPQASEADRLLRDAFDGDLSDLLFTPLSSAFDYQGVEDLAEDLAKKKLVLQQGN